MNLTPIKTHKTCAGLTQFWEHESVSTATKMKFSTFIPSGAVKGCVIWLSGLTCTEENFITKAGAQKYLEEQELMVICPDTSPRGLDLPQEHESYDFGSGAGFYIDATTIGYKDHYKMFTYISEELHSLIQKQFGIAGNKISIMGHSMGGHGALVIGLRHPDKFQSISAFAPIANPIFCPWGQKAFLGYLGNTESLWKTYDATALVQSGKRHPQVILIDQGKEDEFYKSKQLLPENFQVACQDHDQPVQLRLQEGYDHSYYFISTFIESHIKHHAQFIKTSI